MDQFSITVINIVFKFYPDTGPVTDEGNDLDFIIVQCRQNVFGIVFQDGHHGPHRLQFLIRHAQLAQALDPGHFVIHRIVAIVGIPHGIGLSITNADAGLGGVHTLTLRLT